MTVVMMVMTTMVMMTPTVMLIVLGWVGVMLIMLVLIRVEG